MPDSLQERLKARRERWFTGDEKVPVPGYGGELVARYGRANWSDFGALAFSMADEQRGKHDVEAAVKLLVAANTGCEAHVNGEVAEIEGVKMGRSLAAFLGIDLRDVDTDEQAVYLIFPGDTEIMEHASEVAVKQRDRTAEANGAIAGK